MQDIYDILAKHFAGETSQEEEQQVAAWKVSNEEEYDMLQESWALVPEVIADTNFKSYDAKAALAKIEPQLNGSGTETKVFRLTAVFKYAAAASVVLLLGLTTVWYMSQGKFTSVVNDGGMAMELDLPDGSTIWLAENSTLEYNSDFKNHRDIKLDGEAFFEVAPDKEHPFVIQTSNGEIEVLGTAFNVNATSSTTEVSVDHGRVAFRNNEDEVELTVGQSASSEGTTISEVSDVNANYQAWRTGVFHFNQTPVAEVVAEIDQYYEEAISLDNNASLDGTITGDFEGLDVKEFIEVIVLTCGLEAEYGEGTIRLK